MCVFEYYYTKYENDTPPFFLPEGCGGPLGTVTFTDTRGDNRTYRGYNTWTGHVYDPLFNAMYPTPTEWVLDILHCRSGETQTHSKYAISKERKPLPKPATYRTPNL